MLPAPFGEAVTRLRAVGSTDEYRNAILDWSTPDSVVIAGCGVAQGGSFEPSIADRQPVTSDFDIYLPPGADVLATDRLVVRGQICEVVGQPFTWHSPFTGWEPGTIASARIVEG